MKLGSDEVGLELEVLVLKEKKPLRRRDWLQILDMIDGEEVYDECSGQLIGKRTRWGFLKTDTTSAIIELSMDPSPVNSLTSSIQDFLNYLIEVGNVEPFHKGYLPHPSLKWYLENATPRGHYRLLQWYGYQHWRISMMASSQIWIDVNVSELPCVLNALNVLSPVLLKKYANSECCGWKEYRVKSWELFSKDSWASIPHGWLPRSYKNWREVIFDILSGRPQEARGCKDLSITSFNEMALELVQFGESLARSIDMGLTKASSVEIIDGMQRWSFRPAIARWKTGAIDDYWLHDILKENAVDTLLKGLKKTMIEVRFLPYLPIDKLTEVITEVIQIKKSCDEVPTLPNSLLEHEYIQAARGNEISSTLKETLQKILKR